MPVLGGKNFGRMNMDNSGNSQDIYRRISCPEDNADIPPLAEMCISHERRKDPIQELLSGIAGGKPDADKLLIAALLFMLVKEGADIKLMLALAYILL